MKNHNEARTSGTQVSGVFNGGSANTMLQERNDSGTIPVMESVSAQLRRALLNCGEPMSMIAERTGINKSVLSRFVSSGREIRSDNLDRLCDYMGLKLTSKPARKRKEH